jgi:methylglutaconyl-CoA hydratase
MKPDEKIILTEQMDSIGVIKLNQPEKRNALSPTLIERFLQVFNDLQNIDKIKVIVITGTEKIFCAGADLEHLNELRTQSSIVNELDSENISRLFTTIYNCNLPTIAAVNGAAIAGGCGLASACDFIFADEHHAKFGYTEVRIGFVPALVSYYLVKRVGEAKARQILISGKVFSAVEALRIGLVDHMSNDVVADALLRAKEISLNSAKSICETKKLIRDISNMEMDQAIKVAVNLNTVSRYSTDFEKGITNFLNKRGKR